LPDFGTLFGSQAVSSTQLLALRPSRCQACRNPLSDQSPFELSDGTKNIEHHQPNFGRCVDSFGNGDEPDPTFLKIRNDVGEMRDRTRQAIKPPHDEGVSLSQRA